MFPPLTSLLKAALVTLCVTGALAANLPRDTADTAKYRPRPYKIDVSHEFIDEFRRKAARYRQVTDIAAPAWFDGPPSANISQISKFIAYEYDWYKYQETINSKFHHYITTVPAPNGYPHDQAIHFIHHRSNRKDAIPILLLHGWPSTSLEWEKVVEKLVNPQDSSKPAFHVVAPDLPGFGFSPAPVAPGLGGSQHASIFASLMQQLGYCSYAIYSTDLGYVVGLKMVDEYKERILNHLTDFYIVLPSPADVQRFAQNATTAEEARYIAAFSEGLGGQHSAYSAVHSTYPLSIAYALNDSPMGFLAWMWQLDYTVRDLSVPYTPQELVSQALLLYLPGVYGNIRSYKELFPALLQGIKPSTVPTSVLQWGYPKPAYPELANANFVVS